VTKVLPAAHGGDGTGEPAGLVGDLLGAFLAADDTVEGVGGDLLLINTSLTAAPVHRPQDIYRLDPRLSGRIPPGWQQRYDEWLAGPLRRYGRDVTDIEFTSVLDTASCSVPGSYAVEVRARVLLATGRERTFTLFRFKRHDALRLVECMKELAGTQWTAGVTATRPAPACFTCSAAARHEPDNGEKGPKGPRASAGRLHPWWRRSKKCFRLH
jgi:hypothetical protein